MSLLLDMPIDLNTKLWAGQASFLPLGRIDERIGEYERHHRSGEHPCWLNLSHRTLYRWDGLHGRLMLDDSIDFLD